jgi:hypothetical protein
VGKNISMTVRAARFCKSSSLVALAMLACGGTARAADSGAALQTMVAASNSVGAGRNVSANFDLGMMSGARDSLHLAQMAANDTDAGPSKLLTATGLALGDDGVRHYIEGPVVQVKTGQRGPMFEMGALGGGDARAPFLAHVGMGWVF